MVSFHGGGGFLGGCGGLDPDELGEDMVQSLLSRLCLYGFFQYKSGLHHVQCIPMNDIKMQTLVVSVAVLPSAPDVIMLTGWCWCNLGGNWKWREKRCILAKNDVVNYELIMLKGGNLRDGWFILGFVTPHQFLDHNCHSCGGNKFICTFSHDENWVQNLNPKSPGITYQYLVPKFYVVP